LETGEDYKQKINQISNILNGKTKVVEDFVVEKIKHAASIQNFQLAGLWRDRLQILKETIADQKIILPQPQDIDLITLITQVTPEGLEMGSVYIQNIRSGKIINVNNFLLSGTSTLSDEVEESSPAINSSVFEFLQRFLGTYKSNQNDNVPALIQAFQIS
jgi:excinuclease UvrABC nuclease subunit